MSVETCIASVVPVPGFSAVPHCDIVSLRLDTKPADEAWATLSADERQRARRYRAPQDQWAFVSTRHTVRCLIGERLHIDPATVQFGIVGRGKPVLAGASAELNEGSALRFSVAHTDGIAVIALASRPIGIDVERVRPRAWDMGMAALVLSSEELRWVRAQADIDTAFFRCWTRKEAWVKMGDLGLVDELTGITLTPHPHATIGDAVTGHATAGVLADAIPWPGVVVACAAAAM